jgi:hypothetical protein
MVEQPRSCSLRRVETKPEAISSNLQVRDCFAKTARNDGLNFYLLDRFANFEII